MNMAQLRHGLIKMLRPCKNLNHVYSKSSLQMCIHRLNGGPCILGRMVLLRLTQSSEMCRTFCVKASAAEETAANISKGKEDHESNISEEDARDIALNAILHNIKMPALTKHLTSALRNARFTFDIGLYIIMKAYFQRLSELVLQNPDLKDEKAEQLLNDPSFQKMADTIEERFKALNWRYLTLALSCLLEITSTDVPVIKFIETGLLKLLKETSNLDMIKEIAVIHENHQETGLRKLVYQSAVTVAKEMSEKHTKTASQQFFPLGIWDEDANSSVIQELQGKAMLTSAQMSIGDVKRMLYLLALKKIHNTPLITVLLHRLKNLDFHFKAKDLKNLFFACSALSINDETLMAGLSKNLMQISQNVTNETDVKHLCPILISCSRLSWKNEDIIAVLVNQMLKLLRMNLLDQNKLTSVIVSLGHLNWKESDLLIDLMLEKLKGLKEESPLQWLNVVWSLAILEKASIDHVLGVLTDDFCQQIEHLIQDKHDHFKTGVHTKLLNVAGCAMLEHNTDVKPRNYSLWMSNFKKKNMHYISSLRKSVSSSLHSLEPESVSSNIFLDYGYVLDYELYVSQADGKSEVKNKERVAVKLLEYKDMLRTVDDPEPDGKSAMCIRHLEKMGYRVVMVPYYEWMISDELEKKQQYLRLKIEAALQGD